MADYADDTWIDIQRPNAVAGRLALTEIRTCILGPAVTVQGNNWTNPPNAIQSQSARGIIDVPFSSQFFRVTCSHDVYMSLRSEESTLPLIDSTVRPYALKSILSNSNYVMPFASENQFTNRNVVSNRLTDVILILPNDTTMHPSTGVKQLYFASPFAHARIAVAFYFAVGKR